jgi:predicted MPP superfamily phosphohydrolase
VLTVFGTVVHLIGWIGTDAGGWAERFKPFANAVQMVVIPGWAVIRLLTHVWHANVVMGALIANAIGWGVWWAGIRIAIRVRTWLLKLGADPAADLVIPSRRKLLVDAPMALVGLTGMGSVAEAAFIGPWRLTVPRYTIPIADLPASLDGLRIVQIADTHLGPRVPSEFIRDVVARAIAMKPDLFMLCGDYIHNGVHFINLAAELMRPLIETNKPVVGVLGNHDWYGDGIAMGAALRRVGVQMIDNDRVFLSPERNLVLNQERGALCIAGLGDLLESVVQVEPSLYGVDPSMPRLVMAHNPDTAEIKALTGRTGESIPRVDLMISGHTHGGQVSFPLIGPPIVPSRYGQKYAGGLVQGPAFRVLISRGVGMSMVPVRFNVPPELVEITLTRA